VGDAESLARAIAAALSDRARLAADAAASLDAVRERFALERTVGALCSLYREVVGA
jgi:glycosyltransferase involved in cell wall biosynthesis